MNKGAPAEPLPLMRSGAMQAASKGVRACWCSRNLGEAVRTVICGWHSLPPQNEHGAPAEPLPPMRSGAMQAASKGVRAWRRRSNRGDAVRLLKVMTASNGSPLVNAHRRERIDGVGSRATAQCMPPHRIILHKPAPALERDRMPAQRAGAGRAADGRICRSPLLTVEFYYSHVDGAIGGLCGAGVVQAQRRLGGHIYNHVR